MSPSNGPTPDDPTLVRYLVGSLPDEEAERLDELSVVDEEFAVRLNAAEHDLVDAYVNGELTGDTLDRFTSHYLSSPVRLAKVEIATALQRDRSVAPTRAHLAAPSRAERAPARIAPQWWMAAAAALVMAVAGYLLADNVRLRRQMIDSRERRSALEQRERQLEHELDEQRSATSTAAQELSRVRAALAALERAAADQSGGKGGVIAVTLLPSKRDAGSVPTIAIRSGADTLTLRLQLEDDDFTRYRVALEDTANGRIVWRSDVLRAAPSGDTRSVSIAFRASLLAPGIYTLALAGIPSRGEPEVVGNYTFRVVLQ